MLGGREIRVDLRALVTGPSNEDVAAQTANPGRPAEQLGSESTDEPATQTAGPTLEQLLPDPAQREVVRRTLVALDVIP